MFPYMNNFLCKTSSRDISSLFSVFILIYYLRWCSSFIFLSENIKTDPGPTPSSGKCFSISHWNLNSITAHNYAKLSLLTAYIVLILFFFQRHISTLKLHLITRICNFQVMICSVLISLPIMKKEVFVFITNRPFL